MTFGGWREILFADNQEKRSNAPDRAGAGARYAENALKAWRHLTEIARFFSLAEVGDFFVEVGEGGFEGFAVIGVSGGGEVVGDSSAR
jgi:hypothetical protein